jgi:SAM-dependent methyltransferase
MRETLCPICGPQGVDREVYAANFRADDLTPETFSARRLPDRLHYRMVRCLDCGLLRSNPILPVADLTRLYTRSHFTYGEEAEFTRRTYGRYLRRAGQWASSGRSLLEIGCGDGFFLEEALKQGFDKIAGVEPSEEAIARANSSVRQHIRQSLYGPGVFPDQSFDLICAFQVFDHVPDPEALLNAAHEQLRDGGTVLFINHNEQGFLNRLLREASPIIDVEHTVLFGKKTIRRLFEKCGFQVREVFDVRNTYPVRYWARLAPLPRALKTKIGLRLERSTLGQLPITLRAGNLGIVATKGWRP